MVKFGHVYLSWRKGIGYPRHLVGRIKRSATKGTTFQYFPKRIREAEKDGFAPYTEFPLIDKVYGEGVLESFGQRIIKSERADSKPFYDFWAIDLKRKSDPLYMLSMTQGWIPTDNFEFLADFQPTKDLYFITDIAGLTEKALEPGLVKVGDVLEYKHKQSHPKDGYAVEVYKDNLMIGYIKKVHSKVFYESKSQLKLVVKSIDQNGVIKRIFVAVSF